MREYCQRAKETRAKSEEPEPEILAACNIEFLGEKGKNLHLFSVYLV